jgi:transposase-like protein
LAIEQQQRTCPHCGSDNTTLVQRGYAGATDENDQFFTCEDCGRITYEILSRTPREIRIGRLEPGRTFRHDGADYVVSRVLKVGLNESLVYVKPAPAQDLPTTRLPRLHR